MRLMPHFGFLFTLNVILFTHLVYTQSLPTFTDESARTGLDASRRRRKKYGGPTIADLDRDGHPDMIFCHHDDNTAELYFNKGNGVFRKAPWRDWHDTHGIVAGPISPFTKSMLFTLSIGGSLGSKPAPPVSYLVNPERKIRDVSKSAGLNKVVGRGRTALFMNLSGQKGRAAFPDLLYMNAPFKNRRESSVAFAYENVRGKYKARNVKGLTKNRNWYAMATDIDGDLDMEVVTYWGKITVWKLTAPFTFTDISGSVLPKGMPREGVVSVAELDFDNDGDFDLYVARTKSGDLQWTPGDDTEDFLLENRNGKYVDVSRKAKLPRNTMSRGVTVADFNNDGYIDILVTQYKEKDIFLFNRGDGTFRTSRGLISRPENVRGDNAVAVDYNSDGFVDIVSSQGDQHQKKWGGRYRLFKNTMLQGHSKGFISVRVGNAKDNSATPLHAVVTVKAGTLKMTRRVGSPGATVSQSYIETMHFGLGNKEKIESVTVQYTSGYKQIVRNRKAGETVQVGRF